MPDRNEQYPGAPKDVDARREYFWRRNALIQRQDPDEAVRLHRAALEKMEREQGKLAAESLKRDR